MSIQSAKENILVCISCGVPTDLIYNKNDLVLERTRLKSRQAGGEKCIHNFVAGLFV
jgi:hypothetical protein